MANPSRRGVIAGTAALGLTTQVQASQTVEETTEAAPIAREASRPDPDAYRPVYREAFATLRRIAIGMNELVGDILCRAGRQDIAAEDALLLWDIAQEERVAGRLALFHLLSTKDRWRIEDLIQRGLVIRECEPNGRPRRIQLTEEGEGIIALIRDALDRQSFMMANFGPERTALENATATLNTLTRICSDIVLYRL